jgi:inosine/xanthosine triphosphatase
MYFFVGTTNKAKLEAVRLAVKDMWPDAVITGCEVESGVAAQPMTDDETQKGSENRARRALKQGLEEHKNLAHTECLGVGLEGGVTLIGDELWSTVWVTVVDQEARLFSANGARMKLAPQIAQPLLNGEEMGPLMERLMGVEDVKQKQGMLGVVTRNYISRTEEYGAITKLAVGLWFGREWTKDIKSA